MRGMGTSCSLSQVIQASSYLSCADAVPACMLAQSIMLCRQRVRAYLTLDRAHPARPPLGTSNL